MTSTASAYAKAARYVRTPDNAWRFMHASLLDYFIASSFAEQLVMTQPTTTSEVRPLFARSDAHALALLGKQYMTSSQERFLGDYLKDNPALRAILWEIIEQGKEGTAIRNASSILLAGAFKVESQQPESADDYYIRGYKNYMENNNVEAIYDFAQAIALKPAFAVVYYYRGVVKHNQGNDTGAIEDYSQVIALKPDYAAAYYSRQGLST